MQTSRIKPALCITSVYKNYIRNVAVNAAAVKETEESTEPLKSWREIPGPPSLPIIGQLHNFLPGGMFYNLPGSELVAKLRSMYGPIIRLDKLTGRPPLIFLFDAESSAKVLRGENWLPVRPGFLSLEYYRTTYRHNNKTRRDEVTGLITDHGDLWKRFRSTVNPVMLQPKIIKLYSSVLDEVSLDMVARLKSLRGDDNTIKSNFDVEMNLWALESIGVVALGRRLNCFDPNLPEDSPERRLIQVVHDIFNVAEKLDFRPSLWRYFSTPNFKKAMKVYAEQESLTKHFMQESIKELEVKKKTNDEKGVLEKLLEIDEEVAVIMASDMLFAGVDTAANTMIYTLFLLATNQDKQDKLREELMAQQDKRPYLKACIKESLRVLPVVSGNIRQTTKEYNLLGYKIPKNMFVSFGHQDMSLAEDHYQRAKEYLPERWLTSKDDPLYHGHAHPFAYSPFGFGVRSCIGRRIAELEIETFLARVIQNFKVEWFGPPLKVTQTSLNYATGPFNFVFKDA